MQGTIAAGIQLGASKSNTVDAYGGEATYCLIRGLFVGGHGLLPGGYLRFVREGHNVINIFVPGKDKAPFSMRGSHPSDKVEIKDLSK